LFFYLTGAGSASPCTEGLRAARPRSHHHAICFSWHFSLDRRQQYLAIIPSGCANGVRGVCRRIDYNMRRKKADRVVTTHI
jgi:hypothetical protein